MRRVNFKVLEEYFVEGLHIIIGSVNVGSGRYYIEYYVGVPEGNNFYCKKEYLDPNGDRDDIRMKTLVDKAFNGNDKPRMFSSIPEMLDFLDGVYLADTAWLSFARHGGTKKNIDYSFLRENYFYYGGGFNTKESHSFRGLMTEKRSFNASKDVVGRMVGVLSSTPSGLHPKPFDIEKKI